MVRVDPTGDYTRGLISGIRSGTEGSLGEFLERYGAKLLVFIHYKLGRKLGSKVEAEDVLQDFFLSLVQDQDRFLDKLDGRGVQRTLYRLVENRIKDLYEHHFKTQKRDAHREITEGPPEKSGGFSLAQLQAATNSYVGRLDNEDEYRSLRRILEQLDAPAQELFILKYVEECTNEEMAERLDVSVSTVKRQTSGLMQKVQVARRNLRS